MTARTRFGRLRHPLAALLAVGGVVVGSVAAMGGSAPASAAPGDLVGTTVFSCVVTPDGSAGYPAFAYNGQITLTAGRETGSSTVGVVAKVSDMSPVAPVDMDDLAFTNELSLEIDGTPVKLQGSGRVTAPADTSFAMPDLQGTFESTEDAVDVEVTGFGFVMAYSPTFNFTGVCSVTSGAALGTLTLTEGSVPTIPVKPTVTTTVTATVTPSPSGSAGDGNGSKSGKPASGKVTLTCMLMPFNSEFSYPGTISVSGYRESAGDPVSLTAKMADIPGISIVPIDGVMDVTLGVQVGGEKTTLKASTQAKAPAKSPVAVPPLKGEVEVDGDELEVKVNTFTFNFPADSVSADCTAPGGGTTLGKMTVGSEAAEDDDEDTPPATTDPGTSTSSGGTLPKTGGGDSLPVVALWALALTLLGAAGLLCVPQVARKKS
ncbi:MAG TPA: hypothetical protein VMF51_05155 [Nocardioides sp.]|uniref:hypothetical protein n=1 Tax=Nocardioides sp. TaxID=35761 RepID=UPI002CE7A2BD|nr:hypothetical protein [Nocardioides sp.]HTW14496.1 hypothetical protein [Nocardioides sp.]